MSYAHLNEFERIKLEYDEALKLLKSISSSATKTRKARKGIPAGIAPLNVDRIQSAAQNMGDAYALLLIAKAEFFMRAYLQSVGVHLPQEPKLSSLIDQCRKKFNSTSPRIPIRRAEAEAVHVLREQRNNYAHGYATLVFASIDRIVPILGAFFAHLP